MSASNQRDDQEVVSIRYRNYRGETSMRQIKPSRIWFGATDWHPEPQWLMDAMDVEKDAERSFALRDILDFDPSASNVPY
jgi:predicted DNA-binding transcriptional regulator YafY